MRHALSRILAIGVVGVSLASCATVGQYFEFGGPQSIQVGKTTRKDIVAKMGEPFQIGYDDGHLKYTYGYYKYRVFGDNDTKDLTIIFDKKGVVQSYSFATSIEDEKKKLHQ